MFTDLFKKTGILVVLAVILSVALFPAKAQAAGTDAELYNTALPYTKYFKNRAITHAENQYFEGMTRNLRDSQGEFSPAVTAAVTYGGTVYENMLMQRALLGNNDRFILNDYLWFYQNAVTDPLNPVLYYGTGYTDGSGNPLRYGAYADVRILGRLIPGWTTSWNWATDTKGTALLIVNLCKAYQLTSNNDYKTFAIFLATNYILPLQDTDGGVRLGPDNMFHSSGLHFWWYNKTTECNAYVLAAMNALYTITSDAQWNTSATNIKTWLKNMYDTASLLFSASSVYNPATATWVKTPLTYIETVAQAMAPIELMFTDAFFGTEQSDRDSAVESLLTGAEIACALRDGNGMPALYKFAADGATYGSIELSSQMAMAYLKAAQGFSQRATPNHAKAAYFLNRYNSLIANLEGLFTVPTDELTSKTSPYAVYYNDPRGETNPNYANGHLAGNVLTGTGARTPNCLKALASAWFGFAKAGYDPLKLDGGPAIPTPYYILNLVNVPWYQLADPYNSTGATSAQTTLNYLRQGAGSPDLTQDEIYEYAIPLPANRTRDLKADELNSAMNHFQPGGGYHFSVRAFDPVTDPLAMNKYMRDICHWIDYQVPGVTRQNVPVSLPILGSYDYWITIQGFATDIDPCPAGPWTIPDFTVYGFWAKDPYDELFGMDTYKTAADCEAIYFQPLNGSGDTYDGQYVLVAEPPPIRKQILQRRANVKIAAARPDPGNLAFIKVPVPAKALAGLKGASASLTNLPKKKGWRDMVPQEMITPAVIKAFEKTVMQKPIPVGIEGKPGTNYYLIPFSSAIYRNPRLVNAIIAIGAQDGRFKEASWIGGTKSNPVSFLNVDKEEAVNLVKDYLRAVYDAKIAKLDKRSRDYATQKAALKYKCQTLIIAVSRANEQLLWGNRHLSGSQLKPYWKLTTADGTVYYVTQDKKVKTSDSDTNAKPGDPAPKINKPGAAIGRINLS